MKNMSTSVYFEDLVEAVVLLHDLLLLRVQDGAADQQVEVLAGQTGPHHLSQQKTDVQGHVLYVGAPS